MGSLRSRVCLLACTLLLASSAMADDPLPRPYQGLKLVRVTPQNPAQLLALEQLGESLACIPAPTSQPWMLPPEALAVLDDLKITYEVVADDVQTLVDAERRALEQIRIERGGSFFATYRINTEINAYLDELAALRPDIATVTTIGFSHENRPIRAIRIAAPAKPGDPAKPAVAINGGQHAREWISPASVMWAIDQLIRNYGTDPRITQQIDAVDWYFVPVVNPDGYHLTHNGVRLWRKNRRNNGPNFGVDLNRNWSTGWGGAGSSVSSSSDTYRGPFPFSEPETIALSKYIAAIPNLRGYIDVHSYSQLVLAPWGYTDETAPRAAENDYVGRAMRDAMVAVNGVSYQVGPTATILYLASGVAGDWALAELGAYGFGYELRDTGSFGFELPASQIIPTARETFAGFQAMADAVQLTVQVELTPPLGAHPTEPTDVSVSVVTFNTTTIAPGPGGATLAYRIGDSGPFTTTPLSGTGTQRTGTLPPAPCGTIVQAYAQVLTSEGQIVRDPPDAPASLYEFEVLNTTLVLADDFESDLGWLANAQGADTATTGRFERAAPQATTAQPGSDHTPEPGTLCWVTDARAGAAAGTYDIDNGATSVTSPALDLSPYTRATVSFWLWFYASGGAGTQDVVLVDATGDGSAWTNLSVIGSNIDETAGGWLRYEVTITDPSLLTSTPQLRLTARDLSPGHVVEAAIDDIMITGLAPCIAPPTCPGDTNGDGLVNGADLSVLLGQFGQSVTPGASADVNGDGQVTGADLSVLLASFGNVC